MPSTRPPRGGAAYAGAPQYSGVRPPRPSASPAPRRMVPPAVPQFQQQPPPPPGQTGQPEQQPAAEWAYGSAHAPRSGDDWPPQGGEPGGDALRPSPRAELPEGVGGFAQPGTPPSTPAQSMPRGFAVASQDPPGQTAHLTLPSYAYQSGQPGWVPR